MGILGLSVYDSVIVAEEFGETTKTVMIEEYARVFGFNPKIEVKQKSARKEPKYEG